jgi:hypothetical protein
MHVMTHERLEMEEITNDNEDSRESEQATPFQHSDLLRHIISYVGEKQYRFVAAINKDFQAAYLELFHNDTQTYYNASTIKHAIISMEDGTVNDDSMDDDEVGLSSSSTLCTSAARHGSVFTL